VVNYDKWRKSFFSKLAVDPKYAALKLLLILHIRKKWKRLSCVTVLNFSWAFFDHASLTKLHS